MADSRPRKEKDLILARIPSRSGGPDHVIQKGETGIIYCNCAAGRHSMECWALQKFKVATVALEMIRSREKVDKRKEQQDYVYKRLRDLR